jgi:hypothetical protein
MFVTDTPDKILNVAKDNIPDVVTYFASLVVNPMILFHFYLRERVCVICNKIFVVVRMVTVMTIPVGCLMMCFVEPPDALTF